MPRRRKSKRHGRSHDQRNRRRGARSVTRNNSRRVKIQQGKLIDSPHYVEPDNAGR